MSEEIKILNFEEHLDNHNTAFLCGNGFSMNFDSDFRNIYQNLYIYHKKVIYNSSYKVKANENFRHKCIENFKSVKQFLRNISEDGLYKIFEDAFIFAKTIKENKRLVEELWEKKKIKSLVFGLSEIDILNQICEIGENKGITYVSIEHWTILIHFYFAIKEINTKHYQFPNNNSFITVLNVGNKSPITLLPEQDQVLEKVIFNGFTTYYRFLFSTAIFSNGKAVEFSKLSNIDNLEINKIKSFLNKYNLLLSLNYDKIVENLVNERVVHLHGEFVENKIEYVYSQSLGLDYDEGYVSFSDILIGDYFTFKTILPIINVNSRNIFNKKATYFSKNIETLIQEYSINCVVIFGMNIENDQHVIRNLMLAFFNAKQQNPQLIYCYYTPEEKKEFEEQFKAVITFSEEVSEYAKNIKVSYIKTQDVLKQYFLK
ncbi:hypothetical protein [Rummeliibacillus pycnus]|uniref:hypothetical protein n=1 Tax=Rummeliibacillus pycnus TaxID=101070 RepID=UPI000C9ABE81|nr:hypothetical protein [Rummeliibacillus pycnus]